MPYSGPWSTEYIESLYERWKSDPNQVDKDWRFFFQGFELGFSQPVQPEGAACDEDAMRKQSRVEALVYRYRDIGHLMSCLDPLEACLTDHPLISLSTFGLGADDMEKAFYVPGLAKGRTMPLKDILQLMRQTYCRSIGVEYMHLQDPHEREWLREKMEPLKNEPNLLTEEKIRILNKLCQAKQFEQFVHKRYLGQKRFSLEGAEVIIPMMDVLFDRAASHDCREIVLGMSHRGRLNVQVNIMGKPYEDIFREFEDQYNPEGAVGTGDVKYHKGFVSKYTAQNGKTIDVMMANNPSHLEAVNPVVEGMAKGRIDAMGKDARVLPVLLHGDAAFAGQGIVAETLNMSQLEGYKTGGTIHIVVNNQIGYTTLPEDARSTRYSTDIAKGIMVPIFHVHGEDPEAVAHAVRLACDYRMAFAKDVVIDVVCYRLYGHNEGDEPYFTAPLMYDRIRQRPSLDELYATQLLDEQVLDQTELNQIRSGIETCLTTAIDAAKEPVKHSSTGKNLPDDNDDHSSFYERVAIDTALKKEDLLALARQLSSLPDGFNVNPKLEKLLEKRKQSVEEGTGIDWGNAETLAFASIVQQGQPVRLSGEDSQRGTFSQRHSVLFDTKTNAEYTPIAALSSPPMFYPINSLLSEAGVLGFEYGYSLVRPDCLTLWEAQFGDFVNNAQVVIDQFIVSGETKWGSKSGLTLLLPHGYEGMGPEHSSARIERFLQLCANENIQVCNPTTPAQYFHLLRRQAMGKVLKPLVIMTPKSLLRHPLAVSDMDDFTKKRFEAVLDDPLAGKNAEKVIFVSGKIYYELLKARDDSRIKKTAIIRIEQLYPFPQKQIENIINTYKKCREWLWTQEEPENQGPWQFVSRLFQKNFSIGLTFIGRDPSPSPATGYHHVFVEEQENIVRKALLGSL
ncbi:MAG: 2-oxoglutarate dehydrogenase E1 component [Desulfobacteraceae bacterium]|nr:MAG: 2-oxoglutarate dehydrogenase E1 component [Desulfobacteraceae bacterium]